MPLPYTEGMDSRRVLPATGTEMGVAVVNNVVPDAAQPVAEPAAFFGTTYQR